MEAPSVFIDPPTHLSPEHAQLFKTFGLEAYLFIFDQQQQEAAEEEEARWQLIKQFTDEPEPEDDEVDYGPEEPDEYGND
jgi:hypothetical protein